MEALDLSTVRRNISHISQVNGGSGVISVENPKFGTDLMKRNAILRDRIRIMKKERDFQFRGSKLYKLQLDRLKMKYDDLQNYLVKAENAEILKRLDESRKEISRLKEIMSIQEQESPQNLQVEEPFVNGEFADIQAADVIMDIVEHEEEIVKAEPQYVEVEEQDNAQVNEPFVNGELPDLQSANGSIGNHEEEQIVIRDEPQEREAEEEEALHQCNKSAEIDVNSAEFEKRVEILNVQSKGRQLRIHLCRVRPEMYLQNGKSSHSESNLNLQLDDEPVVKGEFKFTDLQTANVSIGDCEEQIVEADAVEGGKETDNKSAEHEVNPAEFEELVEISSIPQNANSDRSKSNLVCKWIHMSKEVCHQGFLDASELKSHLMTDHLVTAKWTRYTCCWQECPSNGRPFASKGKLNSHLDKHIPQISNETQINQIQNATATEPNSQSENLRRGSLDKGLEARLDEQGGKGPFGSLGGNRVTLSASKKIHNCSFEGCRMSTSAHEFRDQMHSDLNPDPCPFIGCTHNGNKPYDGSDNKYARKLAIKYNLNWHSCKKPLKCPYGDCNWTFDDSRALYRHLRTHTIETLRVYRK